jgi:tRNA (adenine-N(1)-)-methyltransferase non-catalytic subunit
MMGEISLVAACQCIVSHTEEKKRLLIASIYDPIELLEALTPKLGTSRPIVIYSRFKESLHAAFTHLRTDPHYVNSQITESWLREYQVPTGKGGMHPQMMTSGSGGYLLTATTVVPESADLVVSTGGRKKASRNAADKDEAESSKKLKVEATTVTVEEGEAQR